MKTPTCWFSPRTSGVAALLLLTLAAPAWAQKALQFSVATAGPNESSLAIDPLASYEVTNHYVSGGGAGDVAGSFAGTNINAFLGANTFYTAGYTGSNTRIANVEAGQIWSGHETLGHVIPVNHASALNEVDRHATWVGMILGGRMGGASPGEYQRGMAYNAAIYSGGIASQWSGTRYATGFSTSVLALIDHYQDAAETGLGGQTVDVINNSWGGSADVTGMGVISWYADAVANRNPRTLIVFSSGNSGAGPNQVGDGGSAYNDLTVAALGVHPTFTTPSSFSSGGPNDYDDPVNAVSPQARQVVDIAAPGQQLGTAYYGGTTGGNGTTDNPSVAGTGPTGGASGVAGGANFYTRSIAGTSFAAPTVSGGAALLYDAARTTLSGNPDARDARVMKAVLMNSADKTTGWNNGQVAHSNGNGGVSTSQGLDNRVGTGRMNLTAAFDQLLSGTTDVVGVGSGNLGAVDNLGWDFGQVVQGTTNDYYLAQPLLGGSTFTATLSWFRDRDFNYGSLTLTDQSFDDLDLEIWSVVAGVPTNLISESISPFNTSEHFSFTIPGTGLYAMRVRWFGEVFDTIGDANSEFYGLAWSGVFVPEPNSVLLFAFAAISIFRVHRRANRAIRCVA